MDKLKIQCRTKNENYHKVYDFSFSSNHYVSDIILRDYKNNNKDLDNIVLVRMKEQIIFKLFDEINKEIREFCYNNIDELMKLEKLTHFDLSSIIKANSDFMSKIEQLQEQKIIFEEIKNDRTE
jgi:hypothetical protein